jgi:hypothetical protein
MSAALGSCPICNRQTNDTDRWTSVGVDKKVVSIAKGKAFNKAPDVAHRSEPHC